MISAVYAEDEKKAIASVHPQPILSANRLIKLSYPTSWSKVDPEIVSAKKATSNY